MAAHLEPFAGARAGEAADRLIHGFGGLGRALHASPEQLVRVLEGDRLTAEALVAARRLVEAGLRERVTRSPIAPTDPDYRDFLLHLLNQKPAEHLHATFLDHASGYLGDEYVARGSGGQVGADVRKILERALDLGARAVILAHNHPSGNAEPSEADLLATRHLRALLRSVDIALLDHLVVGGCRIVSLRERGAL